MKGAVVRWLLQAVICFMEKIGASARIIKRKCRWVICLMQLPSTVALRGLS